MALPILPSGMRKMMKLFPIVFACVAVFPAASTAADAKVPAQQYAELIIGQWEVRTYGYEFKADGTATTFNPFDGQLLDKGTWSIKGRTLTMNWESLGRQVVPIRFINPSLWEWQSPKGPWKATRISGKGN